MGKKTFVNVTNQDIYNQIITLQEKVDGLTGKVSVIKWMAATSLTLVIVVIGWLVGKM